MGCKGTRQELGGKDQSPSAPWEPPRPHQPHQPSPLTTSRVKVTLSPNQQLEVPIVQSQVLRMTSGNVHPGVLHSISVPSTPGKPASTLVAFEHTPSSNHDDPLPVTNTLIFLGGLFDGLQTVPFVAPIVSALPPSWSLIEPVLSSAYRQWGFSSLGENVAEIAPIVDYFRRLRSKGKVVLLGHSTGSQQVMHYLLSDSGLPSIDGGILQGSASDREAIDLYVTQAEYDSVCKMAQSYIDEGRGGDILPFSTTESIFKHAPVSAKRWLSLASPGPLHNGEDDYFSSDLDDGRLERTFGRVGKHGTRLMFLFGSEDQYVPDTVDKAKLVERWHHHIKQGGGVVDLGSGVVEGASHTLQGDDEALEGLISRVLEFLKRYEIGAAA